MSDQEVEQVLPMILMNILIMMMIDDDFDNHLTVILVMLLTLKFEGGEGVERSGGGASAGQVYDPLQVPSGLCQAFQR